MDDWLHWLMSWLANVAMWRPYDGTPEELAAKMAEIQKGAEREIHKIGEIFRAMYRINNPEEDELEDDDDELEDNE